MLTVKELRKLRDEKVFGLLSKPKMVEKPKSKRKPKAQAKKK